MHREAKRTLGKAKDEGQNRASVEAAGKKMKPYLSKITVGSAAEYGSISKKKKRAKKKDSSPQQSA